MDIEKSHESFEHIYNTCWRYVAFDESNFNTFSLEYLRIILATCGEVDTVGKCLAQIADPGFVPNKSNILKWHYAIQCAQYSHSAWADCPDYFSLPSESTVVTLDETIKLLPWKGFGVERK